MLYINYSSDQQSGCRSSTCCPTLNRHLKNSPQYQNFRLFFFLLLRQCHLLLFFYIPAVRVIIRLSKLLFLMEVVYFCCNCDDPSDWALTPSAWCYLQNWAAQTKIKIHYTHETFLFVNVVNNFFRIQRCGFIFAYCRSSLCCFFALYNVTGILTLKRYVTLHVIMLYNHNIPPYVLDLTGHCCCVAVKYRGWAPLTSQVHLVMASFKLLSGTDGRFGRTKIFGFYLCGFLSIWCS